LVAFAKDGQAVGFLNLRLRLSDYLLEVGGHIGYSIRPSERGKGYAKESLRQGLQVAKGKNIKRALLTCSTENPASRAVILANGGVYEDVRNGTERYWIDLE
ncbi:GNAT family N-acetyltransferase, partial [Streptococcus pneumoniae]|nr:GNAT family N-acetyltransferase [Streptococcus pneumoniae]